MSVIDTGGPAFPENDGMGCVHEGMTLRDYFAAKAVAGCLANPSVQDWDRKEMDTGDPKLFAEDVALQAYFIADAMLAERNKDTM
jgi:hypothetical protein